MKTLIVLALFVAIASAAPRKHKFTKTALEPHTVESEPGQILRYENDNIGVGPYNYV